MKYYQHEFDEKVAKFKNKTSHECFKLIWQWVKEKSISLSLFEDLCKNVIDKNKPIDDQTESLKVGQNTESPKLPDYLELLKDIDDSRFTVLPGKESVRVGARLMYGCIMRHFNR
jgi:hypothetical protein